MIKSDDTCAWVGFGMLYVANVDTLALLASLVSELDSPEWGKDGPTLDAEKIHTATAECFKHIVRIPLNGAEVDRFKQQDNVLSQNLADYMTAGEGILRMLDPVYGFDIELQNWRGWQQAVVDDLNPPATSEDEESGDDELEELPDDENGNNNNDDEDNGGDTPFDDTGDGTGNDDNQLSDDTPTTDEENNPTGDETTEGDA